MIRPSGAGNSIIPTFIHYSYNDPYKKIRNITSIILLIDIVHIIPIILYEALRIPGARAVVVWNAAPEPTRLESLKASFKHPCPVGNNIIVFSRSSRLVRTWSLQQVTTAGVIALVTCCSARTPQSLKPSGLSGFADGRFFVGVMATWVAEKRGPKLGDAASL